MRLFLRNELILLDPKPLSAEELKRTTKFKMRCRRYVVGDTADGMLEMRPCNNHIVFSQMRERLSTTLQLIGHELHVSPELEQQFLKKRELAEERYRLGNEIKRHDAKHLERFNEFAHVVNKTMVRPLKERQMWDAFFLASMQRAGNFSVPGSGKTATVLGAFAFLRERGLVRRIMVLCPKNAFDSWRTEWQACFGDKLQLNCFSTQDPAYSGSRLSNKRSTIRASVGGANLLLVNYEAAPLVADELASVARHDTLLVLDEVHRVKRVGGYYATAALTIAQGATATFALTGTPLPNTYEDLYNFLNILYPREYDTFFGFDPSELKNADDQHQLEINRRIQPFYCRTTKRDLGVPSASPDRQIMLDADSDSIEILRCLMARYRKNKLTLMLRVLQLENDPTLLLHDLDPTEYRWLLEEDETTGEVDIVDYSKEIEAVITRAARTQSIKRDACRALVNELVDQGNSVIIWCIFTSSMRNLRRDLLADGIDARIIDGSVPIHDRTEILEAYRDGKFPALITNPHTLAESVSLHSICHDAVYFEYSFNLVHLLQSKDRIHRLGLAEGQDTRYYFLMERYTVGGDNAYSMDQQIYQRLCGKEQTMLRAIEAGLIETQPTTEEDLEAIFNNLFKDER